jgi:hypothetical protein
MITSKDYIGKPCTLTPYARLKVWKEKNPVRWKEIAHKYSVKRKEGRKK